MATPLEMTLVYASGAVVPYLIGSVPFGFLIGKMKGLDIRTQGSGNIGATNVTRVIGKNWGKLCFLLDLMKGILPVVLVSLLVRRGTFDDPCGILPAIAALATVCGHIYPVYLHFKGGTGISTAAGAILALNPPALLSAGVLWVIVFLTSRYVSLASIAAAVSLPVFAWIMKTAGVWAYSSTEMILFCVLAVMFAFTEPKWFLVPVFLQIVTFAGYQEAVNGESMMPMWVFAVIQLGILALFAVHLLKKAKVVDLCSRIN